MLSELSLKTVLCDFFARSNSYTFSESLLTSKENKPVSHFFRTKVHFTDQNGTDPKNKKILIIQKLLSLFYWNYICMLPLKQKSFLRSFKFLWRHVRNLQTRTCFQKLVCKIRFKHQNDLKRCKLVTIDIINHLWKFHENQIDRSEVISWSVNC